MTRYLKGVMDFGTFIPVEDELEEICVHSDTNWAQCKRTRKSIACGVLEGGPKGGTGGTPITTYVRGQKTQALSSAEAEFGGGVTATAEGIFMQNVFNFFRFPVTLRVLMDSSAARGIFQRQGVGRVRHLEVKLLWVQQLLMHKKYSIGAVSTHDNKADVGTKVHDRATFERLRLLCGRMSLSQAEKATRIVAACAAGARTSHGDLETVDGLLAQATALLASVRSRA